MVPRSVVLVCVQCWVVSGKKLTHGSGNAESLRIKARFVDIKLHEKIKGFQKYRKYSEKIVRLLSLRIDLFNLFFVTSPGVI